ncbi:hypothetical protein RB653_009365 [Dictyostelium firmibasis]|uniref:Dickkopf N-terminal cysteine-rich domain-containing protein n=1 Tax=Dictyostelium firmibasis TaxID=79012 RepID=A0AAN7Z0K5_9MYCE
MRTNRRFIFLIIFYNLSNLIFVSGDCINCLKEGEICDLSLGNCNYGLTCFNDQTRSNSSSICTKYLKQGDSCSIIKDSDLCDIGLKCLKDEDSKYKCLDYGFSTYLEKCKLDSDCSTTNQKCVNGYCYLLNYKQCFSPTDCTYDQICSLETSIYKCVNMKLKGGYCYASRLCFNGLICVNGVCTERILNQIGQFCNSDYDCDTNNGLYCSNFGICEKFFEPTSNNCKYSKNNSTESINQCGEYQSCGCENKCIQSSAYPIKYSLEHDLKNCAYDNECVYTDSINMLSKQSCINKYCKKHICNYKSSLIIGNNSNSGNHNCGYNKYLIDKYCSNSSPSNSFISIIIIIFSLILISTLVL